MVVLSLNFLFFLFFFAMMKTAIADILHAEREGESRFTAVST